MTDTPTFNLASLAGLHALLHKEFPVPADHPGTFPYHQLVFRESTIELTLGGKLALLFPEGLNGLCDEELLPYLKDCLS